MTLLSDINRRNLIGSSVAAGCLAGCGVLTPAYTYRYRLNLSVTIDGSEKIGTSVLETKWVDTAGYNQGLRWVPKTWGDAFLFRPSEKEAVIGLLGGVQGFEGGFRDILTPFVILAKGAGRYSDDFGVMLRDIGDVQGDYPLPKLLWPFLLYLPDIRNLKAAVLVTPSDSSRFAVGNFTIGLARDPISRGIETNVPCLSELSEQRMDPHFRGDPRTLPPFQLLEWRNVRADGEEL